MARHPVDLIECRHDRRWFRRLDDVAEWRDFGIEKMTRAIGVRRTVAATHGPCISSKVF